MRLVTSHAASLSTAPISTSRLARAATRASRIAGIPSPGRSSTVTRAVADRNTFDVSLEAPLLFFVFVEVFALISSRFRPPLTASRPRGLVQPGRGPWTVDKRRCPADVARIDRPLDLLGQSEQGQGLGDRPLPDLESLGQLPLREPATFHQGLECPGLFDRPKVFAEAVLDQLVFEQVLRGRPPGDDHAREGLKPSELGGTPASLADDDDIDAVGIIPPHPDRLKLAPVLEAVGQPGQRVRVELDPGLVRVRGDPVDPDSRTLIRAGGGPRPGDRRRFSGPGLGWVIRRESSGLASMQRHPGAIPI